MQNLRIPISRTYRADLLSESPLDQAVVTKRARDIFHLRTRNRAVTTPFSARLSVFHTPFAHYRRLHRISLRCLPCNSEFVGGMVPQVGSAHCSNIDDATFQMGPWPLAAKGHDT